MVFGTRQRVKRARDVDVKIEGMRLQVVPTYKYLGFTLDATLSFGCHVNNISRLIAYKANLLSKVRKFLSESTALKIYKTMIVPYLDYGDVIYNSANQEGLEKLQRLQNRCLKICMNFNARHNTKDLHVSTNTPMLKVRRECHINNFMFAKVQKGHLVDDRDIPTRAHDAPMCKVKVPKIETYKRSVEYAGAVRWNSLPVNIRNTDDLAKFKRLQKNVMLNSLRN